MTEKAKVPDNDTDWEAIDIFVFSNGQQYSPPRKYHLCVTDLNLWESTLKYLAETQYGHLHSSIELYTLDGNRLVSPLELNNGASYVAVAPLDIFVDAGYDKYLIRATRSWEKRQANKTENVEESDNKILSEMDKVVVRAEDPNFRSRNQSLTLNTIVSSMVKDDTNEIVKQQPLVALQRKPGPLLTGSGTVKPERKNPSIQRPAIIRKITLPAPQTPSTKPSFKKNNGIKPLNNVKKPRLEGDRQFSPASTSNQVNKCSTKSKVNKPTTRSRESSLRSEAVLPKVQEVASELKASSVVKIITANDGKLSRNSSAFKNVGEDKEIILVSTLFQNPNRDLPSFDLNPIPDNREPVKQLAMTEIIDANDSQKAERKLQMSSEIIIGVPMGKEVNKFPKKNDNINLNIEIKKSPRESTVNEKLLIEYPTYPTHKIIHKVEENTYLKNEVKTNTPNINENIHESLARRHSVTTDKLLENQYEFQNVTNKVEENINMTNELISSNKTIILNNSESPKPSIIAYQVFDDQHKTNKKDETHDLPLSKSEKLLNDQYVVNTLKQGEVINLKLNIEIKNRDDCLTIQHNANLISHSVTNTHTEKGSQVNMEDQLVAQNNLVLSLIEKEVNDHHIGNNHRVIIVQYSGCKYCNDKSVADQDKRANKNYMNVENNMERCYCSQPQSDIRQPSFVNPVSTTFSCMSSQRMAVLNQLEIPTESASHNIDTPHQNTTGNLVEEVSVSRKKSVAINEDNLPNSRDLSTTSKEIITKTQLLAISTESILVLPKSITDNSTQTEWCDILLEARLLEDGRYTFRWPSLEMLKYYKLT